MSIATLTVELRDTTTKIVNYFRDIGSYFASGTGIPPSFEDVVSTISTDELEQSSQAINLGSNSFSSGSISSSLYETAAYAREMNMGLVPKSEFYSLETAELNAQADQLQADLAKKINYIQGKSPEQGITL